MDIFFTRQEIKSTNPIASIDPANAAALRASAAQEVRNARRVQAAIVPDAGFHSPRFRAFVAATR